VYVINVIIHFLKQLKIYKEFYLHIFVCNNKTLIIMKYKKGCNRQSGGDDTDEEYEDDFELENTSKDKVIKEDYNKFELDMLTRMIKTARKTEKDTEQIFKCEDIKTLIQHTGICYYVSLIHSMFFSRGMRKYVGRQIKHLESKLLATNEYEDHKWYFIMLWNMIERPWFYKNVDWTFDLCHKLDTSLVSSCKLMEGLGKSFQKNISKVDKNGLVLTLGYDGFIEKRTSTENADKGGYVGETLRPLLCSLEMNNVLFISVDNYDYDTKQKSLEDYISKVLKLYNNNNIIIDIIALKIYSQGPIHLQDDDENPHKIAENLFLDGSLYVLDSVQFDNIYDNDNISNKDIGHVIAGITCPYSNGTSYPRLVLNSWNDNDIIETDWNKSHIVIRGNKMTPYNSYRDAVSTYNNNKKENQKSSRAELFNMIFSVNKGDCLYFFTREETIDIDKLDIQRIQENILTKAYMLFGEKPKQVMPSGSKEDSDTYYVDLIFSPQDGIKVKENLKSIGLTHDFYNIEADYNTFFAISVNYNKFVQLCQEKLGIVEDILVITGKVPMDIVIDDVKGATTKGGGNVNVYPLPPNTSLRVPNGTKTTSSILDNIPSISTTNKRTVNTSKFPLPPNTSRRVLNGTKTTSSILDNIPSISTIKKTNVNTATLSLPPNTSLRVPNGTKTTSSILDNIPSIPTSNKKTVNTSTFPLPPNVSRRVSNGTKATSSILDRPTNSVPRIPISKTRYLYFGVKGEISQSIVDKYSKQTFIIENVNSSSGYIPIRKGSEIIEKRLKDGLRYYRFDYDKYLYLFVKTPLEALGAESSSQTIIKTGGNKQSGLTKRKKKTNL